MTDAVRVRALRVSIGGRTVLDGVDLTALPGRVTALVGPSGSGKTTTGRALLGELPPDARVSGEVRVPRGPVGYVPQHPASVLNPARRAGALLRDIARRQVRDLPRARRRAAVDERVRAALAAAQLPDATSALSRYPHQLSGGQQQRLVLAQALLLGTRVVVADEPTTGLDVLIKQRVAGELAALARQGIAVVLLSHDLAVVRALADEVVVLRAGRVVESGPPDELWARPRHPGTRELLDAERAETRGARAEPGPVVLRAHGLTAYHRGAPPVLRDADLEVRAGERLALVGRSGSGKTTLARCLSGLHSRYGGTVTLDGRPLPPSVRHRDRERLAAVQYVFQDARAAFDEHRPVLDQVARTAVRLRGTAPERAREEALELLARAGLPETLVRRRPGALSGGELQRAALARALLARPRVLLCDEITSGLDAPTRRRVLRLLTDLAAGPGGPALVLITHDPDAAWLADRIAVLDGGTIVEQGPAARVLAAPAHPFTRALADAYASTGEGRG
ncbi:ABC transporter ATP-binding protein [Streptomyces gamaensis]|uniref:ABC transporter ATP-binding protein n=1 Tax=Streptomyces gamaensis TaxID=1763542 RepID=A0ABW0Z1A9_9ACTN